MMNMVTWSRHCVQ